ncbi:MAG: hypothetical protein MUE96_00555 [Bacteroidia bacterium]|jgi:hypothetical protein|nr:hypothetical protein [Bacteroidia bacterium]
MISDEHRAKMRLTALWALSESGLGGMMHAFKIPFTGFFLGGFAIVVITLIAQVSKHSFKSIMQATALVLMVKAVASPHAPPMAYIAVGFQGLAGAVLYQFVPYRYLAAILFGGVALFESAVQKFLVATLLFGKSIWEALDTFVSSILKDLSVVADFSFSFWLIAVYTAGYTLWGMLLGWWSAGLFNRLQQNKEAILAQFENTSVGASPLAEMQNSKRMNKLWMSLIVLCLIVLVFALSNQLNKAAYAFVRTIAALMLLFWVITPLVQWCVQYWVKRNKQTGALVVLMEQLPELKGYVKPALLLAKKQTRGLAIYPKFIQNLLILTLYAK